MSNNPINTVRDTSVPTEVTATEWRFYILFNTELVISETSSQSLSWIL